MNVEAKAIDRTKPERTKKKEGQIYEQTTTQEEKTVWL